MGLGQIYRFNALGKKKSYLQKALAIEPNSLIAFWPITETTGTTLIDASPAKRHGAYAGAYTLAQRGIGDGGTSAKIAAGALNIYSASFASAFNGAAGTVAGWVHIPITMWTDSTERYICSIWTTSSNNMIRIERTTTNNVLLFQYNAGGTTKLSSYTRAKNFGDWIHVALTWDKAADAAIVYVDGIQAGATLTGLGTWAGAPKSGETALGARTTTPADSLNGGWLQNWGVWSKALSASQVAALGTRSPRWGGGTVYIATDGDDGNTGLSVAQSLATWAQVETILNNSNNNSRVQFAAGTYAALMQPQTQNTMLLGGAGVIVDGEDARNCIDIRASHITVDNFEVTQGSGNGVLANAVDYPTIKNIVAHDSTIGIQIALGVGSVVQDVETYANTQRGIYNNACTNWLVSRQYGHNEVAYSWECESNANDGVVEDCWWIDNASAGGIIKTSSRVIMRRCVAAGVVSGHGIYFKAAIDSQAINCDSYNNNGAGILLTDNGGSLPGSTGAIIKNCICKNNVTYGISVDTRSQTGFVANYNDYEGNGTLGSWGGVDKTTIAAWRTATSQEANSQTVDPDYATVVYGGFVPQVAAVLTGADDAGPQGHTG